RLLAALLVIVLGLVWLDAVSETARAYRSGKPWAAWLSLKPAGATSVTPVVYLLTYSWDRRTLHLVRMPESYASRKAFAAGGDRRLTQFFNDELRSGSGPRLSLRWPSAPDSAAETKGLKTWIASRPRGPRFWLAFPGVLRRLRRFGNPE